MSFPCDVYAAASVEVAEYARPVFRSADAYVAHYARRAPAALAAVFGGDEISYARLEDEVAALSHLLLAKGAAHGDVVAVYSDSRPEAYVALLAVQRIGAIFLGISPRSSADEVAYQLGDAAPAVILDIGSARRPLSLPAPLEQRRIEHHGHPGAYRSFVDPDNAADAAMIARAHERVAIDDAAMLLYTSGSTGFPKGALLSHRSVCSCAYLLEYHRCVVLDRPMPRSLVLDMPISHNSWSTLSALPVLVGGGTVVFHDRWDALATLRAIERYRLNTLMFFPPQLNDLLGDEAFGLTDLSSLDTLLPMVSVAPHQLAALRERAPRAVPFTGYGLTEAAGVSGLLTDLGTPVENVASTVGRPVIPGLDHKLVDDAGAPVAAGTAGELWMRGPIVFTGYLNRPDATAAALDREGWLHTGDILVEGADGDWRIVGRKTEMYKSGGENVYPSEVERVLLEHPEVEDVAVVAAPDPRWTEIGVAFVTARGDGGALADDLQAFARARLSNFKIPKHVVVERDLPRRPNGKIERVELKERAARLVAERA